MACKEDKNLVKLPEGTDQKEDEDADGRIILRWIVLEQDSELWCSFISPGIKTGGGLL
jgi:hypothetical protein